MINKPLDDQLDEFMKQFPHSKVKRHEDYLLYYRIPNGYVHDLVVEANRLIAKLGLYLLAKSNSSNGCFADTFLVEPLNRTLK